MLYQALTVLAVTELQRLLDGYGHYEAPTVDRMVRTGKGVGVERYAYNDLDEKWLPYLVRAVVENTPAGPRCVDLRLVARADGPPITPEGLRRVPLGRVMREVERDQPVYHEKAPGVWAVASGEVSRRDRAAYRRSLARRRAQGRRWQLDEPTLGKVADVYRRAVAQGAAPTAAVQRHFGLNTRGQAAKWVQRARQEGQLGPAPGRRKKGERP
jgi:helix-turn-helix protein